MRQIAINGSPAVFTTSDLPIVIHGRERSGASLYAIIAAASIYRNGDGLFFWSAHHMAKEEFAKEMIPGRNIHRIDSADEITSRAPQVIIMENESPEVLGLSLAKLDPTRVLFVKNFETLPEELRKELLNRKLLMIAGDLEKAMTKEAIFKFETQIFFSPYPGVTLPPLGKYEGFIVGKGITTVFV
jgi:hypothetical protein